MRPASSPVFDSQVDEAPYHLTTWVNGKVIDWQKPMADPFHHTTMRTRWSWRDRVRILLGRPTVVVVSVGGHHDTVEAILELDDNYRGEPGSERRQQSDNELRTALTNLT